MKPLHQKAIFIIAFICILLIGIGTIYWPNKQAKTLDAKLQDMVGDRGHKVPGLGVIVFRNGKEVYSNFFGNAYIDTENSKNNKPFTRDTKFRVASLSKQFTVFTIMQLVETGKISLDEDISEYLGFAVRNHNHPDIPITVRMLASHTSSLRDGNVYNIPPQVSVREFFYPQGQYWENGGHYAPANEPPGTYFHYANINYGLLGTIIERVTGQRFDLYQKDHIFKDLEIHGDYLPANLSAKDFALLGTVYHTKNKQGKWIPNGPWIGQIDDYRGIQPAHDTIYIHNPYAPDIQGTYTLQEYVPGTNATIFSPQGGLRISCEEMAHALVMLMNHGQYKGKQVLQPSSVNTITSKQWIYNANQHNGETFDGAINSYGLGLYQIDGNGPARVSRDKMIHLVGHTGEAYGLLAGMFWVPGTQNGFLYIMNGIAQLQDNQHLGKFSSNYIWEENIMDAITSVYF